MGVPLGDMGEDGEECGCGRDLGLGKTRNSVLDLMTEVSTGIDRDPV